jgi:hypothetical protein
MELVIVLGLLETTFTVLPCNVTSYWPDERVTNCLIVRHLYIESLNLCPDRKLRY